MTTYTLRDLVTVARSDAPEHRNLLAESLGKIVLSGGRTLSEAEQNLVYDILRRLVHDVEMRIRRGLAETLSDRVDTPRDLVVTLANDVIEVAHPILTKSTVLQDSDLIELVLEHTDQHRLAITERATLSETVSESLLETGDEDLIEAVLNNQGARIHAITLEKLVDHSAENPALREPLAKRADLPPTLATRMVDWVGDALRDYLQDRISASTAESPSVRDLDQDVSQAVAAALGEAQNTADTADTANYESSFDAEVQDASADLMQGANGFRPHPRVLVRALEDGDIFRFEDLFRDFTGLGETSVARILYDSGPEALAISCKACGIDHYSFSDILCHLHGAGDVMRFRETRAYLKNMDYFERIDREGAAKVVRAWIKTEASD